MYNILHSMPGFYNNNYKKFLPWIIGAAFVIGGLKYINNYNMYNRTMYHQRGKSDISPALQEQTREITKN